MPFPLAAVLAAAPSVISAAADIIRVIRENKTKSESKNETSEPVVHPDSQKLDELSDLLERQAKVIEELALNNSNLALAVRNNRILSAVSIAIAFTAVVLSIWL
jgi:hypothetical protein